MPSVVTELSRWGRSTIDLVETLQALQAWDVSVLAVSGLQFDLSTPHGKMIASVMAALAEFERDLIRDRVTSGLSLRLIGRQVGLSKNTVGAILRRRAHSSHCGDATNITRRLG